MTIAAGSRIGPYDITEATLETQLPGGVEGFVHVAYGQGEVINPADHCSKTLLYHSRPGLRFIFAAQQTVERRILKHIPLVIMLS